MTRDNIKDAEYYERYIAYQDNRISKKKEKLASCDDDEPKANRVRLSLLNYQLNMVFALFSAGEGAEKIGSVLVDALDTASHRDNVSYDKLLNLLSIAIFIGKENDTATLIKKYGDEIKKDKLLNCLASFCKDGSRVWEGTFQANEVFDRLDDLGQASDKTGVIANYLEGWYDAHSYAAWHDSHKGEYDTFVGYWSFESAALAKIFDAEIQKLSRLKYFPTL